VTLQTTVWKIVPGSNPVTNFELTRVCFNTHFRDGKERIVRAPSHGGASAKLNLYGGHPNLTRKIFVENLPR
jgi:hypothetical protein